MAVRGAAGIATDARRRRSRARGSAAAVREGGCARQPSTDEVQDIVACLGTSRRTAVPRRGGRRVPRLAGAAAADPRVREESQWKVAGVAHASPDCSTPEQRRLLVDAVTGDMQALRRGSAAGAARHRARIHRGAARPADPFSASSPETIDRLERVAAGMNVHVARIGASDLRRLPEYDALFIRSLTGVKLPSFQFALRAEALDMPVIDDSQSIIRCSNKVFLEELLRREGVPLPRTRIVTRTRRGRSVEELGCRSS
jgi:hypothetical protein